MDMGGMLNAEAVAALLPSRPRPHISFRAGVLNRDSATNRVEADPRKGVFQIVTSTADGLMHLQWRTRASTDIEQDLIIFSGEVEVNKVNSCPPAARVYVLKWKEGGTRMFFWMQGSDPSQDVSNIASVNNLFEHGPEAAQQISFANLGSPRTPPQSILQSQPNPAVAASPRPAPREPVSVSDLDPISLESYQAMLPEIVAEQQREEIEKTPVLLDLLNADTLRPLLENADFQQSIPDLLQHLPEQDRCIDKLADVLRSAPFRSQLATLTSAIQTGHVNEILNSFGLPSSTTERGPPRLALKQFYDALIKYQNESRKDN